ncbi:MAG: hypothetical protein ACK5M3_19790 [Dysgonomonas sp.]
MKKRHITSILFVLVIASSCTFTNRESGMNVIEFINEPSFTLSKKALRYAIENKADSLLNLFRNDVAKNISNEQMLVIAKEAQTTAATSTLPNDSTILVSRTKIKSITGEKINLTYTFPFKNTEKGSIKYIEIGVENDEVVSFFITQKEIKVF